MPFSLPTDVMERRVKLLEKYPKSEEVNKLWPHIFVHMQTFILSSDYVEQKCHALVTTLYNLNPVCHHIKGKENLKYWKQEI